MARILVAGGVGRIGSHACVVRAKRGNENMCRDTGRWQTDNPDGSPG